MPHPADHPAVALAITRGLPGQMQKAKASGDTATAAAIEAPPDRHARFAGRRQQRGQRLDAGADPAAAEAATAAASNPIPEAAAATPAGTAWARGW
jgi:hypothetical protein